MGANELDLRATTFLRNDAMLSARERLGLTQSEAALKCGILKTTYMRLEKLDYPLNFNSDAVLRTAVGLGISPDDVAIQALAGVEIPNKFVKLGRVKISHLLEFVERQRHYILPSPLDVAEKKELINNIEVHLPTLSYREREIVKLRYGLGEDGFNYTLDECSRIFKVTRECIRLVEARAIKKLKKVC